MGEGPAIGRLEDKVVLITGGGTGIGAATARRFAAAGARVAVTGRRPEPIEAIANEIGGVAVSGDVSDPAQCATAVGRTVERFGGLDILVANAGIEAMGSITELNLDEWDRVQRVNVDGVLHASRSSIPEIAKRGGGAIVVVSSIAGLSAGPHYAAYSTSKTALLGLVRSMAYDLGHDGIRVNALCPGWVRTEMSEREVHALADEKGVDFDSALAELTQWLPLRRMAHPDEIAATIEFLASDDSSFVTGAVLVADGGSEIVDVGTLAFRS